MAINRSHFAQEFTSFPNWNCPCCANGTLHEVLAKRLIEEPAYSKNQHPEDWWEPEHTISRFSALMRCTTSTCGEFVFVTGRAGIAYYGSDEEGEHWADEFEPAFGFPAITVFRLKQDWPEPVLTELRRSFAHVWRDPGAAANRLRTAVECLLDHLKVKKVSLVTKAGVTKKNKLKLHDRIVAFRTKNAAAADLLLAVKWLGNAGSHADLQEISREAVLDGMQIMEHVLHLLFDNTGAAVVKLAASINKKKGPVTKKK